MDEELLFRFVGIDELSDDLREISRNLERVADNSQEVVDRMIGLNITLDAMALDSLAAKHEIEELNDQLGSLDRRATVAAASTNAAAGGIGLMGLISFATANPIVLLITLLLALGAIVPVFGFWLVAISAIVIGMTALLSVLIGAAGAIGILGVATIVLAEALFKAGLAADPLAKVIQHLKDMATVLEKQAYPIALKILAWADQFIPRIQALGSAVLAWFGQRLPAILSFAAGMTNGMFAALQRLGGIFGSFVDHVLAEQPRFIGAFNLMLNFVIGVVDGLLQNLLRLSDWFMDRLPALGNIAGAGFDKLGRFVQWLGDVMGRFVDWVIANWPKITAVTRYVLDSIAEGIRFAVPMFGILAAAFKFLQPPLSYIRDHLNELRPILLVIGATLLFMAFSATMTGLMLLLLGMAIFAVVHYITLFVIWIRDQAIPAIGRFMSALGTFASNVVSTIGGFFAWLISTAEAAWSQFTARPAYWLGYLVGLIIGFVVKGFLELGRFLDWLIPAAVHGFVGFVNAAWNALANLAPRIWPALVAVIEALSRFINWGASEIENGFWGWVWNALAILNQLENRAFGIGADIVRGIINGIWSLATWAWDQARSFVSGLVQGMKDAIGAGSPSLMASIEIGRPLSQGVAHGFMSDLPNTVNIIGSALSTMPARASFATQSAGRQFAPLNINQQQQQEIVLRLDNDQLAKAIIRNVNRWRDVSELI